MARGPKKHLKRLNAPRAWMLSKMGGTWAPRPSQGPHKLRECLPLSLIVRNRLKYALTRREIIIVTARRLIRVDGKIRTDLNYPTGFMDIVSIDKTGENFRVLYDVKGRFVLHRVNDEEAKYKLARVKSVQVAKKASIGRNPFKHGIESAIPFLVTHDGRTIRYPDPIVKSNDTVKIDLKTNKIIGHLKFEPGNLAYITRGANLGRIGVLVTTDKHPGSFDIVHLRDRRGATFATRISNVFVIGEGKKAWISLPRDKGVKISIIEERERNLSGKTKKGRRPDKVDPDEEVDQKVPKPTKGKIPEPVKEVPKAETGGKDTSKGGKGEKGKGKGKKEKGGKGKGDKGAKKEKE